MRTGCGGSIGRKHPFAPGGPGDRPGRYRPVAGAAPWALAAAMALLGCAGASTGPPPLSEPRPLILGDRASFTREIELASSREVQLPELGVIFRVPTAEEVELRSTERYESVHFDIGTEAPVTCHIHRGRQQLANFLAYQPVQSPGGDTMAQRVSHLGSGAEAGHAFLTLHWLYPRGGGLYAVVKQAAANAYGNTVYCQHPEPGYEETFLRAFRTLLSTFFSENGVDPYYSEIVAIRIGNQPIGIELTEMHHVIDGRSRIQFSRALLLPRGPAALIATDAHEISFSSESGDLLTQRAIQWQAGIPATDLVLATTGENRWRVSGRYKARSFDESFEVGETLRSPLGVALDLRDSLIRDGTRAEHEYWAWLPDSDPASVSRIRTRVTGLQPDGFYTGIQTYDDRKSELLLDSDGSLVSGALEMGPAVLQVERIWVAGSF